MPSLFKSSLLFKKKLFLNRKGIWDNFLEAVGMTLSNFLPTARTFSLQPFWMVLSQPPVILPPVMGLTPPQGRLSGIRKASLVLFVLCSAASIKGV